MKVKVTKGKLILDISFGGNRLNSNIKQNFNIWGVGCLEREAEFF